MRSVIFKQEYAKRKSALSSNILREGQKPLQHWAYSCGRLGSRTVLYSSRKSSRERAIRQLAPNVVFIRVATRKMRSRRKGEE